MTFWQYSGPIVGGQKGSEKDLYKSPFDYNTNFDVVGAYFIRKNSIVFTVAMNVHVGSLSYISRILGQFAITRPTHTKFYIHIMNIKENNYLRRRKKTCR